MAEGEAGDKVGFGERVGFYARRVVVRGMGVRQLRVVRRWRVVKVAVRVRKVGSR